MMTSGAGGRTAERAPARRGRGATHAHRTAAPFQGVNALDGPPPLRYAASVGYCSRKEATASFLTWRSGDLPVR